LGKKYYSIILTEMAQFLFFTFSFVILGAKKDRTTNLFSPFSFVAVVGSGIRDSGWIKVRIRDPG
jgi:hypothetical protein